METLARNGLSYWRITLHKVISQPAITRSKLTIETLEQGVKFVPS